MTMVEEPTPAEESGKAEPEGTVTDESTTAEAGEMTETTAVHAVATETPAPDESPDVEAAATGAVATEVAPGSAPPEDDDPLSIDEEGFDWYAIHTYSSYENKVKQLIEHRTALEGLRDVVRRVVIPTESVVEIKGGKKRTTQRTLMPGYLIVQMKTCEEAFNLVKSVKGVSSFVGDGNAPTPLTHDEVANLISIMQDKADKPKPKMLFSKGDQIKVIEGPFANFVGHIEGMDGEKGKLTVMVSIFGRLTPVELDVLQVEAV